MLVTYRLNPAFAVTNLSSSSTSGWRKNQNKQSSEWNNTGRSATAKGILCFSQFTDNKCFTCWEALPPQILLTFTQGLVSEPRKDRSALVNLMPEPCQMFPKRAQHSRGENCQDCKSMPWAVSTYFTMVPLKELQEAGLCASGAFYTPKAQVIPSPLQVLQVHAQVLNPQAAAFPHSGELCRSENNQERNMTHWRSAQ